MCQVGSPSFNVPRAAAGGTARVPTPSWPTVHGSPAGKRLLAIACLFLFLVLLAACITPGSVKPTIKIGLSAPFEGLHRAMGYSALHAVRLAVRQRNEAGGIADRFLVELVALNDFNEEEEANRQAAEMSVDPGVLGVLGGFSPATIRGAALEYDRLGLAFLTPVADWGRLGAVAARVADERFAMHRAVILQAGGPEDLAFVEAFTREFVARGGEIVAQGAPAAGEDVEQILSAPGQEPFLVLVSGGPPDVAGWLMEARRSAPDTPILGGPALGDPLVAIMGEEATEGVSFVSQLAPPPEDRAFVGGYEALSGGAPPDLVAGWAYAAAKRLMDALETAARTEGKPTRAGVRQALEAQTMLSPGVILYRIVGGTAVPVATY